MAQQAVERVLAQFLTAENFRERFFTKPEIATWEAGFTLSPTELEALSRLSHEAVARLTLSRSRSSGDTKGRAHNERADRSAAGVRATEAGDERPHECGKWPQRAGWPAVWWLIPPICGIGLVFYALAWRATRRMQ